MRKRSHLARAVQALATVVRASAWAVVAAGAGWLAFWLGTCPLFRPIAAVGLGLFFVALLALALRYLLFALDGALKRG